MTIAARLADIETEILAAHSDPRGGERRWDYNGSHDLTTKEFATELKKVHSDKFGNVKTVSLTAAVNRLVRSNSGLVRQSPTVNEKARNDISDHHITREIPIPPNAEGLIIRTRDLKTQVSFFITHTMDEQED